MESGGSFSAGGRARRKERQHDECDIQCKYASDVRVKKRESGQQQRSQTKGQSADLPACMHMCIVRFRRVCLLCTLGEVFWSGGSMMYYCTDQTLNTEEQLWEGKEVVQVLLN